MRITFESLTCTSEFYVKCYGSLEMVTMTILKHLSSLECNIFSMVPSFRGNNAEQLPLEVNSSSPIV